MTLTKAELADLLFEKVGLNKREAKDMVEAFFEEIRGALERGESRTPARRGRGIPPVGGRKGGGPPGAITTPRRRCPPAPPGGSSKKRVSQSGGRPTASTTR